MSNFCNVHNDFFFPLQTHILCTIPPYKVMDIQRPVEVYLVVSCGGGKSSELMAHPITYIPIPGMLLFAMLTCTYLTPYKNVSRA